MGDGIPTLPELLTGVDAAAEPSIVSYSGVPVIPIRDIEKARRTPVVTWVLIALNVAGFLFEFVRHEQEVAALVLRFGVVPEVMVFGDWSLPRSEGGALGSLITPLTSMFLHGGVLHLAGNMWFLHVFGDNVEDALGRFKFLLFYLTCGLAAVAAQIAINPYSNVPMIGASGAISGVLAGYVLLFPKARVVTLIPIFIFIQFMEIPAAIFIVLWFVVQVVYGAMSLGASGPGGGVAWFAHIGGFAAGMVLVRRASRRKRF